jgi:hypothetical protein
VEISVWQLLKVRVMVNQMLHRFGIFPNASSLCSLCNEEEESVDHLFIHCRWAWSIWVTGMDWWGVHGCVPKSVKNWVAGWVYLCLSLECKRACTTFFLATV